MGMQSPEKPPYIDWRLDLWKIGAIVVLFLILAVMALWQRTPDADDGAVATPTALLEGVDTGDFAATVPPAAGQPQTEGPVAATAGVTEAAPSASAPSASAPSASAPLPSAPLPSAPLPSAVTQGDDDSVTEATPSAIAHTAAPPGAEIAAATASPESQMTGEPPPTAVRAAEGNPVTASATSRADPEPATAEASASASAPSPSTVATLTATSTLPATALPLVPSTPAESTASTPDTEAADSEAAQSAQEEDTREAAGDSAIRLPLTLATIAPNSVMPLSSVASLEGTGAPGTQVEVRAQYVNLSGVPGLLPVPAAEVAVGTAVVDQAGRWELVPEPALRAGQNVLTLRQLDDAGVVTEASSPVVVNVLSGGEQGPLSLITPTIRAPGVGEQLRREAVMFSGSGLPGLQLRLYLNNRLVGETLVTAREDWTLAPDQPLAPGAYVARVAALNAQGDIMAESAPVAFLVVDSPTAQQVSPPSQPAIPLRVRQIVPPQATGGAMMLSGTATPHSSVAVLLDGIPRIFANVSVEGEWSLPVGFLAVDAMPDNLTVVTNLDEAVQVARPTLIQGEETVSPPVIVMPVTGVPAPSNPPLLTGLARPGTQVRLLLEDVTVAQVTVDALGQWAYVPDLALSPGLYTVTASTLVSSRTSEIVPQATSHASLEIPAADE